MMDGKNKYADYLNNSSFPVFILDKDLTVLAVNDYIEENGQSVKLGSSLSDVLRDYPDEVEIIKEHCEKGLPHTATFSNDARQSTVLITTPLSADGEEIILCHYVFASANAGVLDDYPSYVADKYRVGITSIMHNLDPISMKLEEYDEYDSLEYVDRIARNSYTMLKYSASIKEYSDASKGLTVLNLNPVCLNSILADIAASVGALISNKEYNLEFINSEERLFAEIDVQRFAVILFNIIANSCAFSPQTSTITLKLEKNRGNAVVSVTDEGQGISSLDMLGIFEPFFSTVSEHTKSMGMGLAVAKKLIELHGGRIYVDTEVNAGTTMSFTVPLKEDVDRKIALGNTYSKYAKTFSLNRITDLHMTFAELCGLTLF